MYTSGTTGKPKGIVFTQENIVSKRLARGFALPGIGEGDVFLSLPAALPHLRTVAGADRVAVVGRHLRVRPLDRAGGAARGLQAGQADRLHLACRRSGWSCTRRRSGRPPPRTPTTWPRTCEVITGGRLRHGLSAAGYLDPVVFRSFHRAGIELCSGYGMTEATGGITMTPPGEYVDGSIGKPLPGIECRRAEDGELLIRGPYVSPGYFNPGPSDHGADAEGWFGTGDLVSIDAAGHFRITGRKKEIYKNRAGPDHRAAAGGEPVPRLRRGLAGVPGRRSPRVQHAAHLAQPRSPPRWRGGRRSSSASCSRRWSRARTASWRPSSGWWRSRSCRARSTRSTASSPTSSPSSARWSRPAGRTSSTGCTSRSTSRCRSTASFLRIPNWVLREMGVLQHEVVLEDGLLRAGDRALRVGTDPAAPGALRLGDLAYAAEGTVIDLGALLARQSLWLGNDELARFLGDEAFVALASRRRRKGGGRPPRRPAAVAAARAGAAAGAPRGGGRRRGHLPQHPRRGRAAPGRAARGAPGHRPPPARPRRDPARVRRHLPRPPAPRGRRARRGRAAPRLPRAPARARTPPRPSPPCACSSTGSAPSRCATRTSPSSASAGSPTRRCRCCSRTSPPSAAATAPRRVRPPAAGRRDAPAHRLRHRAPGVLREACASRWPGSPCTTTRRSRRAPARSWTGCGAASRTGSGPTCGSPSTRRTAPSTAGATCWSSTTTCRRRRAPTCCRPSPTPPSCARRSSSSAAACSCRSPTSRPAAPTSGSSAASTARPSTGSPSTPAPARCSTSPSTWRRT